jgi:hypothetical protein
MLLNILETIKTQKIIAHQHLVRLFNTDDAVIENIINILFRKKLINIELGSQNTCANTCNNCNVSKNNYFYKHNCYYKII